MWAFLGIQAGIRDNQTLYRLVTDDVRLDDLIDIGCGDAAIPHRIGIDDDVRAMLALIQAAGFIGADCTVDASLCQLDLEYPLQIGIASRIAASAHISGGPVVGADEDVLAKFWHGRL